MMFNGMIPSSNRNLAMEDPPLVDDFPSEMPI